jgi:hypothetical protein
MRRALLAVALGGVVLTGACSSDAHNKSSATPAAEPSWAQPSAEPDYSANTRQVCGKLEKIFNDDLAGFGTQLGKMIAYKEAKKATEAGKAQQAAAEELKGVAGKIKKETAVALDPEFKAAGQTSAAKFEASAGDDDFFSKIKTARDVDRSLQSQMTEWLSPVAGFCG